MLAAEEWQRLMPSSSSTEEHICVHIEWRLPLYVHMLLALVRVEWGGMKALRQSKWCCCRWHGTLP